MKIWNPLISEGSSGIVNPWKSYQRTFLLKITTKFSSYQFRQGNHNAKYNVYDIKRFSRNMSLTSIGSFNRGRPPISLNSEKIAYFWFNQPNNCFFLFRFLCARHFKFRACSRAKSKLKTSQSEFPIFPFVQKEQNVRMTFKWHIWFMIDSWSLTAPIRNSVSGQT